MKFYDWYRQIIRNPKYRWWIILGSLAYVLSPIDLLPEALIPIIGEIDDVVVITLLVSEVSQLLIDRVKNTKGKGTNAAVDQAATSNTSANPVDVNAVPID